MDSMPMKTHLPPEAAIRSTSSSSRNRLALIWATQWTWVFGCDDVAQQRLGAFQINGEIVVDEKNCHLAFFAAGAGLQQKQFIHHTLVGAEADGVAEESSDGAELAAVGTASSGLDGNNTKCAPAFADLFEQRVRGFRYEIELVEIDRVPGNYGIGVQGRLPLLTGAIHRRIDVFELAANGIVHNLRPGFIGFSECHGVGVAGPSLPAECLVRQVGSPGSPHDA